MRPFRLRRPRLEPWQTDRATTCGGEVANVAVIGHPHNIEPLRCGPRAFSKSRLFPVVKNT